MLDAELERVVVWVVDPVSETVDETVDRARAKFLPLIGTSLSRKL